MVNVRRWCALLAITAAYQAAAAPAPRLPIGAFAALPEVAGPVLSPDGKRVAAKLSLAGRQVFAIHTFGDRAALKLVGIGDDNEVRWWRWVNDEWLVLGLGGFRQLGGERALITRAVAVDRTGAKVVKLGWGAAGQFGDEVLWVPSDGSRTILMVPQLGMLPPAVFAVDVATGEATVREPSHKDVYSWGADAKGIVRFGAGYNFRRGRHFFVLREGAEATFRFYDQPREEDEEIAPLALLPDRRLLVLAERPDRAALWEYDLATRDYARPFLALPDLDIGSVVAHSDRDGIAGARVLADQPYTHWLDPDMAAAQAVLDKRYAPDLAEIESWSRDRQQLVVSVSSAQRPGDFYLFDRKTGRSIRFGHVAPALAKASLAPMKPVRFTARDGVSIPGYLTLPTGRDPKGLPLVVMPHGGPAARDHLGYDAWVQLLANRGYAVLQPNYRGSTGYGKAFAKRAEGQWGLAMQDDVADGARWLVAEGTVDAKRVCIMGASYGGYAALQGAARDPALYRCVIAFAGVYDLGGMVRYNARFLGGRAVARWVRTGAPKFGAVSPIGYPERIFAPALLVHGARDLTVPVKQSREMAEKLRAASRPVEYLEQPLGDHGLSRAEDRLSFLSAVDAFLAKHNPAD